uniref:Uncharacterized protein n=1 Tax=Arundo donax TaxID=35708 RepID=A0A0A8YX33_ARUDO
MVDGVHLHAVDKVEGMQVPNARET